MMSPWDSIAGVVLDISAPAPEATAHLHPGRGPAHLHFREIRYSSVLYVHISAGFGFLGDLAIQSANFMRLLARSARICCTPRCQLARGRFHSEATFNSEPFGSGVLDRPDGVRYSFGGWQGAHRDWPSAGRRKPPREAARRQGHLAIWSRL